MALYTQFGDPAQYYLRKEERRDENLRNMMGMMMQMKMQEREWARQNKLDTLSERRVAAYEQAVARQNAEEQKQWQVKNAAIDQMYPPGSRENLALKSGMSLDQVMFDVPPAIAESVQQWSGTTPEQWSQGGPGLHRFLVDKYYNEKNTNTMAAYRDLKDQRTFDMQLAGVTDTWLDDQLRIAENKAKGNTYLGTEKFPIDDIRNNIAEAKQNIAQIKARAADPNVGITERDRAYLRRYINVDVEKDPYFWQTPEQREDFKRRNKIIGKNQLGKPAPDQVASLYGGGKSGIVEGVPETISATAMANLVRGAGEDPANLLVSKGNILSFQGRKYYIK